MRLSEAVIEALRYADSVERVTAWPDWVSDKTVLYLRRHRLVDTFETTGMMVAGNRFGGSVDDVISVDGFAKLLKHERAGKILKHERAGKKKP